MSLARLTLVVAGITTVAESAVSLITGLAEQLRAAIDDGDEEAIEALCAELEESQGELAAAITANTISTPVEPTPEPMPATFSGTDGEETPADSPEAGGDANPDAA